jgi:hypothetical protein
MSPDAQLVTMLGILVAWILYVAWVASGCWPFGALVRRLRRHP